MVVAGEVGVEETITAVTKELVARGITNARIAVTQAEDVLVLPYIVKRVAKMPNFKVWVIYFLKYGTP